DRLADRPQARRAFRPGGLPGAEALVGEGEDAARARYAAGGAVFEGAAAAQFVVDVVVGHGVDVAVPGGRHGGADGGERVVVHHRVAVVEGVGVLLGEEALVGAGEAGEGLRNLCVAVGGGAPARR